MSLTVLPRERITTQKHVLVVPSRKVPLSVLLLHKTLMGYLQLGKRLDLGEV